MYVKRQQQQQSSSIISSNSNRVLHFLLCLVRSGCFSCETRADGGWLPACSLKKTLRCCSVTRYTKLRNVTHRFKFCSRDPSTLFASPLEDGVPSTTSYCCRCIILLVSNNTCEKISGASETKQTNKPKIIVLPCLQPRRTSDKRRQNSKQIDRLGCRRRPFSQRSWPWVAVNRKNYSTIQNRQPPC